MPLSNKNNIFASSNTLKNELVRKVILLFLLFLSVDTVHTQGQNITFSHLTTDDGLSQFSVNSMYIDEQGIIWIGTREGLNRYNLVRGDERR